MRKSLLAAACALPLLSTACISTKDIDEVRKDINDVKRAVYSGGQKNLQEIGELAGRIDTQSKQLLKSNADMAARIDELTGDLQAVQGKLEETNHRLQQVSQQLALTQRELQALRTTASAPPPSILEPDASMPPAPTSPSGVSSGELPRGTAGTRPVARPGPAGADPDELFRSAYADYTRGHYDLAIAGFREYIETYPKTESTGAARYWIGEAFFSQRKYREAIAEFDVVATRFPRSDKAPSALLKKGFAYVALGEKERGAAALQYVAREHPQSEEATAARQKLKSLGVDAR